MTLPYLPWSSPSRGSSKPCLRDERQALTYREVELRAAAFADQLTANGIGHGDVVGIMLPNSIELLIGMLGAWRVGAAVTPINPTFTAREFEYQIDDAHARIVLGATPAGSNVSVPVLGVDDMQTSPVGPIDSPEIDRHDLALLVYTSDSTGQPKGVMLDHSNLEAMARGLADHVWLTHDDQALLVLPLFHVNSLCVSFLAPMSVGASVTVLQRFAPQPFLEAVATYRPTYFSAVPAIFARLAELPQDLDADTSSLRVAICGAAPVSPELLERCEARFGFRIVEGYGLTEATCASACNPVWGPRKPGTVGRALPGQQIIVVDEHGMLQPPGRRGEIWISGPTVMRGYLGRPEATRDALRDGWMRTGDVGVLDRDGYLRIVDRIKDMIIRGGENIYPKEIEAVLSTHPSVLEAAVVGRPDPVYGEVPIAHVVLAPDAPPVGPDDLEEHCRIGLTKVKVPSVIEIVGELPRNPVGKVDKPALRRALAAAN